MENPRQQSGMESLHCASLVSSILFVTLAAMVAAAAFCLLPWVRISQTSLPGVSRVALVASLWPWVFGCARQHAVESAKHIAAGTGWCCLPSVERLVAGAESQHERKKRNESIYKKSGMAAHCADTGLLTLGSVLLSLPASAAGAEQALPWKLR